MEKPKRGKNNVTACPWFSLAERNCVLEKLFSNSIDKQAEALRHIDVWKARIRPRIPLGIEVTSALAKTMWLQEQAKRTQSSTQGLDDDHFQLMYSTAIIRFVNLVTECGQVMDYPIPIHSIAQKMGIPEWIVELRHSATHSGMPSLEVLQIAAKWALDWLKVKYWETESEVSYDYFPDNSSKHSQTKNDDLFVTLLQIHKGFLKLKGKKKTQDVTEVKNEIIKRIKILVENTESLVLISTLLSEGLMFPSAQEIIEKSSKRESLLEQKALRISMTSWIPIIRRLISNRSIVLLLKELYLIASNNNIKGKYASHWIQFLLAWINKKQNVHYENQPQLCQFVLQSVTPANIEHLEPLLQMFGKHLSPAAVRQLMSLAELVASRLCVWDTSKSQINPTDVLMDTEEHDTPLWKHCPVGVIPSQLGSKMLDLRLPDEMNSVDLTRTDEHADGCGGGKDLKSIITSTESFIDDLEFRGITLL